VPSAQGKTMMLYIKITVATGTGDATTPVAYEDHSSNGPMG
jgi:hypothetical protein